MIRSHVMDRVKFTATVQHPEHGTSTLEVSLPVMTCWDHKPNGEPDEDTPEPPHVWSENTWHRDYAVCLAVKR